MLDFEHEIEKSFRLFFIKLRVLLQDILQVLLSVRLNMCHHIVCALLLQNKKMSHDNVKNQQTTSIDERKRRDFRSEAVTKN